MLARAVQHSTTGNGSAVCRHNVVNRYPSAGVVYGNFHHRPTPMSARHWSCALSLGLLSSMALGQSPLLSEAFGRGTAGAGAVSRGSDLLRVDLPQSRYPDAICADGSAPVIYVRAAADAAQAAHWVVFLQGGGACNSGAECHERWLGRDGNFGANKLSSRFAPTGGIATGGISGRDPRNPFAGWNQVYVYYCSSDGWSGRARDVELEAVHQGRPTRYRMNLAGAHIVDAVFDLLRGGAGAVSYREPGGAVRTLPDLDDARTLLFAGSSAGGAGVVANADRIGAMLRAARADCSDPGSPASCGLRFAAVIDASYGLATAQLDHVGSLGCGAENAAICSYEMSMRGRWEDIVLGFRAASGDASCVAKFSERGEAWRCADDTYVIENFLETPVFIRSDLQDRLVMGNAIEAGFGYQGQPMNAEIYGRLQELQLLELPGKIAAAAAADAPVLGTAVFGPQCGAHETLQHNPASFNHLVVDDQGRDHHTLSVLEDWLDGRSPPPVVERYDPAGPGTCGN